MVMTPVVVSGQTITAMWDPSPAADQVTGYQVCVGTASLSCNIQLASVATVSYTIAPTGGVRTYVDEGATIVTHAMNRPYYEQAWAAPRTINPDRLAESKKTATFETFTDKHVLTDGSRTIEIHQIAGGGHNDAFAMVYLPKEKILMEGDAYTPAAANAPPPAMPNPFSVNLHNNIQRLKLDVRQIAALHGPRLTTMADLRAAIGQGPAAASGTN